MRRETVLPVGTRKMTTLAGGMRMVAPAVEGIDLFKIAGRSISGWIPSLKTGSASHVRQPFCSQFEERLLVESLTGSSRGNPPGARACRG